MTQPANTVRRWTVEQAAERVGVHPETIRRAIRSGELPAKRNRLAPGGPFLIDNPDLAKFIQTRMGGV